MTLFEPISNRRSIAGQLVFFGCWLGVTAVGAILRPSPAGHGTHTQLGLPPCPSVLLFDRPCPGCGLTTSWTATIHGNLAAAWVAHPIGSLLYALFTVFALLAIRGWIRRERLVADGPGFTRGLILLAVVYFGFGVWRMAVSPSYRTTVDFAALR